eukprot:TRINITY_DN14823_c0_g1_i1.p1 TRINITY_DN14823_c0_g1~~TRINITY_DN14823_c0_g1_i1.p1  ORF type:complete len:177 (+),score=37.78 TRINITY_DN14823_c0_g1_i1:262-792(+)
MGNFFYKLFFANRDVKILMVGLDAAGKTTILYKLKLNEVVTTIPTIGFNVESVKYKHLDFTVFDVGGQDRIRPLWKYYYSGIDAVIYVVDSADTERIADARDELEKMLSDDQLTGVKLLVLANKQDLPTSVSISQLSKGLGLPELHNREWFIQSTCATSGDGLYEGLDWLASKIKI